MVRWRALPGLTSPIAVNGFCATWSSVRSRCSGVRGRRRARLGDVGALAPPDHQQQHHHGRQQHGQQDAARRAAARPGAPCRGRGSPARTRVARCGPRPGRRGAARTTGPGRAPRPRSAGRGASPAGRGRSRPRPAAGARRGPARPYGRCGARRRRPARPCAAAAMPAACRGSGPSGSPRSARRRRRSLDRRHRRAHAGAGQPARRRRPCRTGWRAARHRPGRCSAGTTNSRAKCTPARSANGSTEFPAAPSSRICSSRRARSSARPSATVACTVTATWCGMASGPRRAQREPGDAAAP